MSLSYHQNHRQIAERAEVDCPHEDVYQGMIISQGVLFCAPFCAPYTGLNNDQYHVDAYVTHVAIV